MLPHVIWGREWSFDSADVPRSSSSFDSVDVLVSSLSLDSVDVPSSSSSLDSVDVLGSSSFFDSVDGLASNSSSDLNHQCLFQSSSHGHSFSGVGLPSSSWHKSKYNVKRNAPEIHESLFYTILKIESTLRKLLIDFESWLMNALTKAIFYTSFVSKFHQITTDIDVMNLRDNMTPDWIYCDDNVQMQPAHPLAFWSFSHLQAAGSSTEEHS